MNFEIVPYEKCLKIWFDFILSPKAVGIEMFGRKPLLYVSYKFIT